VPRSRSLRAHAEGEAAEREDDTHGEKARRQRQERIEGAVGEKANEPEALVLGQGMLGMRRSNHRPPAPTRNCCRIDTDERRALRHSEARPSRPRGMRNQRQGMKAARGPLRPRTPFSYCDQLSFALAQADRLIARRPADSLWALGVSVEPRGLRLLADVLTDSARTAVAREELSNVLASRTPFAA
jgi:hypothetical protein